MATSTTTQSFYQPYSGTFSAGQYAIYPVSGYDLSLYNTYGTVVPYYIPLVRNTASISLKANETVVFQIDYCIPDLEDAPKYTSSIVLNPVGNYMVSGSLNKIPVYSQWGGSSGASQWYGVPGTISSVGGEYPLIMNSTSGSTEYITYSAMNQQSLYLFIVAGSADADITDPSKVLRTEQLPLIQQGTGQVSYTATDNVNIIAALVYKGTYIWRDSYKTILFKDFKISKYKQITQVSDNGLLIFNNPAQFLKITATGNSSTGTTKSEAVMALDTLYAKRIVADVYEGGDLPAGGKGGESAGGGGTVGGLTYHNTVPPYLQSSVTFSAPRFSGSGFYFPSNFAVTTTSMGFYPSGSTLPAGQNMLDVLQTAFGFLLPRIQGTGTPTAQVNISGPAAFITTATASVAQHTFAQDFQLPAKFNAMTVGVSHSWTTWQYSNGANINFSTGTPTLTSSVTAANYTISHPTLGITNLTSQGVVNRATCTWSCTVAANGNVQDITPIRSVSISDTFTMNGLKDQLGNILSTPSPALTATTVTKTTSGKAKFGFRFMLARRNDAGDGVVWRACNSSGTITPTGNYTTYAAAFTASTARLDTEEDGMQLTVTLGSNFITSSDVAGGDRIVGLFLLAPDGMSVFTTSPPSGRWSIDGVSMPCFTLTNTDDANAGKINATKLATTAYKMPNIAASSNQASAALATADGIFTKTWQNTLTSPYKLFLIFSQNTVMTSATTLTWT